METGLPDPRGAPGRRADGDGPERWPDPTTRDVFIVGFAILVGLLGAFTAFTAARTWYDIPVPQLIPLWFLLPVMGLAFTLNLLARGGRARQLGLVTLAVVVAPLLLPRLAASLPVPMAPADSAASATEGWFMVLPALSAVALVLERPKAPPWIRGVAGAVATIVVAMDLVVTLFLRSPPPSDVFVPGFGTLPWFYATAAVLALVTAVSLGSAVLTTFEDTRRSRRRRRRRPRRRFHPSPPWVLGAVAVTLSWTLDRFGIGGGFLLWPLGIAFLAAPAVFAAPRDRRVLTALLGLLALAFVPVPGCVAQTWSDGGGWQPSVTTTVYLLDIAGNGPAWGFGDGFSGTGFHCGIARPAIALVWLLALAFLGLWSTSQPARPTSEPEEEAETSKPPVGDVSA